MAYPRQESMNSVLLPQLPRSGTSRVLWPLPDAVCLCNIVSQSFRKEEKWKLQSKGLLMKRHHCSVHLCSAETLFFFKLIYYTDNIYKVYKDELENCSCNQFHHIGAYKQVEKNSTTKNGGGNNGSEKWIGKTLRLWNSLNIDKIRPFMDSVPKYLQRELVIEATVAPLTFLKAVRTHKTNVTSEYVLPCARNRVSSILSPGIIDRLNIMLYSVCQDSHLII